MSQSIEQFWINDLGVLFRNGNWYKIFPASEMSMVQILNALTRFSIYLLVIFIIIPVTRPYYYLPIIAILVIIIYYFYWRTNLPKEIFDNMQNTNLVNGEENIFNQMAITNPNVSINDNGTIDNYYQNISYDNYSNPEYYQPNDQSSFANWVYGSPATCKENPLNCLRYEDVRYSRQNPVIDKPE